MSFPNSFAYHFDPNFANIRNIPDILRDQQNHEVPDFVDLERGDTVYHNVSDASEYENAGEEEDETTDKIVIVQKQEQKQDPVEEYLKIPMKELKKLKDMRDNLETVVSEINRHCNALEEIENDLKRLQIQVVKTSSGLYCGKFEVEVDKLRTSKNGRAWLEEFSEVQKMIKIFLEGVKKQRKAAVNMLDQQMSSVCVENK